MLPNNIFRKTGIIGSENLPESTSPVDTTGAVETIPQKSNTKKTIPPSTAHMIGWTLSKEVSKKFLLSIPQHGIIKTLKNEPSFFFVYAVENITQCF